VKEKKNEEGEVIENGLERETLLRTSHTSGLHEVKRFTEMPLNSNSVWRVKTENSILLFSVFMFFTQPKLSLS